MPNTVCKRCPDCSTVSVAVPTSAMNCHTPGLRTMAGKERLFLDTGVSRELIQRWPPGASRVSSIATALTENLACPGIKTRLLVGSTPNPACLAGRVSSRFQRSFSIPKLQMNRSLLLAWRLKGAMSQRGTNSCFPGTSHVSPEQSGFPGQGNLSSDVQVRGCGLNHQCPVGAA